MANASEPEFGSERQNEPIWNIKLLKLPLGAFGAPFSVKSLTYLKLYKIFTVMKKLIKEL